MNEFDVQPQEPSEILPPGEGSRLEMMVGDRALQRMQTTYATAVQVQKPRQLAAVQRRLLDEARLGGEEFYYGWGAGKDAIEGPSVKLAMAVARCWGNCAIELLPVQDAPDSWIFTATFVDLETGFTLQRQFRQSKGWQVYGKLDDARKDDIRFQIGQSKAVRNVVLNSLPASLISRALAEAKNGVREKIEKYVKEKGLPAAVDMIINALAKHGVGEDRVLAKCLVADRKAITVDNIVALRGDLHAIDAGQERAEVLYPPAGHEAGSTNGNGSRANQVAEKLKAPTPSSKVPETANVTSPPKQEPSQDAGAQGDAISDYLDRLDQAGTQAAMDGLRIEAERDKMLLGDQFGPFMERWQAKYPTLKPAAPPSSGGRRRV